MRREVQAVRSCALGNQGKSRRCIDKDVRGSSSADLIEVSDRLIWSLHRDGQVEGEGETVCLLVCQYGLVSIHESVAIASEAAEIGGQMTGAR